MDAGGLTAFPLFARADAAQRAAVLARLVEERFAAGASIFAEGDQGEKMYLVAEGVVRVSTMVSGGEEALAMLRPGSFFGEMSLLDDQARSADAHAQDDCVLLSLSRTDFLSLLEGDGPLAVAVLGSLARTLAIRLRETNDQVKAMHLMSMW